MHFSLQTIVATFALLNICAYANPVKGRMVVDHDQLEAPGRILVTREEASWCGGYTEDGCGKYCSDHGFNQHMCNSRYVYLLDAISLN